jgi:hypothetical protein
MINWGGLCIDKLGVASSGAIWAKFLATGRLLG